MPIFPPYTVWGTRSINKWNKTSVNLVHSFF